MTDLLLIFDLDGTLIDSRVDLARGVALTRKELGLSPVSSEAIIANIGEGVKNLIRRSIPEWPASRLDEALVINRRHYTRCLCDHTRPYPGVTAMLRGLRGQGVKTAVVTNKPHEFTTQILDRLKLTTYFDQILGAGVLPQLKPDPAPLLNVADNLGEAPENCWMIGDHFTDLEAGRRAGMRRCFCSYGFGSPREETWEALAETPEAIMVLVSNHLSQAG